MKMRNLVGMIILVTALVVGTGLASADQKIVVGGKNFTEQYILAELAKFLLEEAGFQVQLETGVGSAVVRRSLLNDQIDLYYEYTGTAYTVYHQGSNPEIMTDSKRVYEWVKEADAKEGLVWLRPVALNNTYNLIMRKGQADRLGLKTISDLGRYINQHPEGLVVGVNAEFWERPDGFKPLMKTYDFRIPYSRVKKMDSGLLYQALKDKQVDVSMGFATDGRIAAFDFIRLRDNKHFFPVYNPAPVLRKQVLDEYPRIPEILGPLAEKLTTEEMQRLNAEVDMKHKDAGSVARDWLGEKGLL
ncbi:MAG: glycine betaine ABC transporter substrate-binding protein [Thermodesulfobacteriota bacterium]